MKSKAVNSLLLVLTAFIWGTAFVAQSTGGDAVGAFAFNSLRNFIGFAVLLPVIFLLDKKGIGKKPRTAGDLKKLLRCGILCGVALAAASNLQQLGISMGSSVGKAGFLTSCYIILVPIAGMLFGRKNGARIWIGTALTLAGLYLLCINDGFSIEFSDTLLILCALAFTVQIMLIDRLAPGLDPVRVSCIEFFICAILSAFPAFFFEMRGTAAGISEWLPVLSRPDAWGSLLYAGVLSSGVAYTLQTTAQRNINPAVASMIFSLESVFSAISGWIILGQSLSASELSGCALIFSAVILSQLPEKR